MRRRCWTLAVGAALVCLCVPLGAGADHQPVFSASIDSAPPGATVHLDAPVGRPLGVTPLPGVRLRQGSHVLYFSLQGHEDSRLYIEVNRDGQVFSTELMQMAILELVPAGEDGAGANVVVDGETLGTLPFRGALTPGRHMVQIKSERNALFTQWIELQPGEVKTLTPTLELQAARQGSILVSSDTPGADVFVDGKAQGQTPIVVQNVSEGKHTVEVRARRKAPYRRDIFIAHGERVSVNPALDPNDGQRGGVVIVNASVGGAIVTVDKRRRGAAPIVLHNLRDGKHTVDVTANGHESFHATCQVGRGTPCEVYAKLKPVRAAIRVEANVSYAVLFVDGVKTGAVPFDGYVATGNRRIEVRAEGYETFSQTMSFEASSEPELLVATLRTTGSTEDEDTRSRRVRTEQRQQYGAASHAALALPVDQATLDLSLGWPFLAELRLGVGVFEFLELGMGLRSYGRLSELEARAKIGYTVVEPWSIALQFKGSAGVGPSQEATNPDTGTTESHGINTWYASAELLNSITLGYAGALTGWVALDAHSDRYDFSATDSDVLLTPDPGRQDMLRLRLGGALEVALNRYWNLWGLIEGIVLGPEEGRRVLGDIYGLGLADTELYFRLGTTYKF